MNPNQQVLQCGAIQGEGRRETEAITITAALYAVDLGLAPHYPLIVRTAPQDRTNGCQEGGCGRPEESPYDHQTEDISRRFSTDTKPSG
ncbi:hypothetical protein H920_04450 [Fukomys damarensis]|uniref:Uncharacterized protein n=1 Tax=Fukomys damarensis TaxID=885580 RepID=A0A091DPQ6_FUKDA|nr:hypothetical protein H920_04450 [Fukomys damarensis]